MAFDHVRNRRLRIQLSDLALAIFSICVAATVACGGDGGEPSRVSAPELTKVVFRPSAGPAAGRFEAQAGAVKLTIDEPDNAEQPHAWQGPLRIEGPGRAACETDASLVTDVYTISGAAVIAVVSYSGSLTYIQFFDTTTCKERWPTIKAFTEGVRATAGRLTILPGCEGEDGKAPASCSAGQVFSIDASSGPRLLANESRALTKEHVGVEFEGKKKILEPKTKNARVVP